MSLSYPLALPVCSILHVEFELERQEAIAPEHGGRLVSVELGPAMWRASYSTQPRNERDFDLWRGFIAGLRGSSKLFYGRDTRRKWPRSYRRTGFTDLVRFGGGAFDGTVATWTANVARDEIELTTLPVGFELSIGDYIDLRWDTSKRSLHRFVTDGAADSAGEGTWTLEPRLPTIIPESAVANVLAPTCTMVLMPGTAKIEAEANQRSIAFDARQHLEA